VTARIVERVPTNLGSELPIDSPTNQKRKRCQELIEDSPRSELRANVDCRDVTPMHKIEGDKVVVTAKEVKQPAAVRYLRTAVKEKRSLANVQSSSGTRGSRGAFVVSRILVPND